MYKGFAIAVLVIAPMIVMLADNSAPHKDAPPASEQPASAAVAPPQTPSYAPSGYVPPPVAATPLPGAGQPMLDLARPAVRAMPPLSSRTRNIPEPPAARPPVNPIPPASAFPDKVNDDTTQYDGRR